MVICFEFSIVELLVDLHDWVREKFQIEAVLNYAFVEELASFEEIDPPIEYLKEAYLIILDTREIFWNYSDCSHRLTIRLSKTPILKVSRFWVLGDI